VTTHPKWLQWAQRLQSISQAGLTYARDPFDRERFEQIQTIAAELVAAGLRQPIENVQAWLRAEAGYATPKVDVRTAVFQQDRILLVRETSDGCWSVPGGWADVGESAAEVAAREVREESGYQVRITRLLAVYDKAKHDHPTSLWYVYKLFFLGELTGGAPLVSHETDAVAWFARSELPELSTERVSADQIARLFELRDNPHWPADFD
jgi:ADP-ribose pyrophosphatase YjhB (NUDIX family)